jgi:hypothetical protein
MSLRAFHITEDTYPNGSKYSSVRIGNNIVGTFVLVEGGYLAPGKRKPRPTVESVVQQLIEHRISNHTNKAYKWRGILRQLLDQ